MVLQVLGASNSDGGGENTCCPKCLFIGLREFRFRSDMFQYKVQRQLYHPIQPGGPGGLPIHCRRKRSKLVPQISLFL